MARGDVGGGSAAGGVKEKVASNFLEVNVDFDVTNVFSVFRDYPNRALYNFDIGVVLREKGSSITRGNAFEQRLETSLFVLQKRGLVRRKRDGRYCLTYEGRQVDIERVDVANI